MKLSLVGLLAAATVLEPALAHSHHKKPLDKILQPHHKSHPKHHALAEAKMTMTQNYDTTTETFEMFIQSNVDSFVPGSTQEVEQKAKKVKIKTKGLDIATGCWNGDWENGEAVDCTLLTDGRQYITKASIQQTRDKLGTAVANTLARFGTNEQHKMKDHYGRRGVWHQYQPLYPNAVEAACEATCSHPYKEFYYTARTPRKPVCTEKYFSDIEDTEEPNLWAMVQKQLKLGVKEFIGKKVMFELLTEAHYDHLEDMQDDIDKTGAKIKNRKVFMETYAETQARSRSVATRAASVIDPNTDSQYPVLETGCIALREGDTNPDMTLADVVKLGMGAAAHVHTDIGSLMDLRSEYNDIRNKVKNHPTDDKIDRKYKYWDLINVWMLLSDDAPTPLVFLKHKDPRNELWREPILENVQQQQIQQQQMKEYEAFYPKDIQSGDMVVFFTAYSPHTAVQMPLDDYNKCRRSIEFRMWVLVHEDDYGSFTFPGHRLAEDAEIDDDDEDEVVDEQPPPPQEQGGVKELTCDEMKEMNGDGAVAKMKQIEPERWETFSPGLCLNCADGDYDKKPDAFQYCQQMAGKKHKAPENEVQVIEDSIDCEKMYLACRDLEKTTACKDFMDEQSSEAWLRFNKPCWNCIDAETGQHPLVKYCEKKKLDPNVDE